MNYINLDKLFKTTSTYPTKYLANFLAHYDTDKIPKKIIRLAKYKMTIPLAESLARKYNSEHPIAFPELNKSEALKFIYPYAQSYFISVAQSDYLEVDHMLKSEVYDCITLVTKRFTRGVWRKYNLSYQETYSYLRDRLLNYWINSTSTIDWSDLNEEA